CRRISLYIAIGNLREHGNGTGERTRLEQVAHTRNAEQPGVPGSCIGSAEGLERILVFEAQAKVEREFRRHAPTILRVETVLPLAHAIRGAVGSILTGLLVQHGLAARGRDTAG